VFGEREPKEFVVVEVSTTASGSKPASATELPPTPTPPRKRHDPTTTRVHQNGSTPPTPIRERNRAFDSTRVVANPIPAVLQAGTAVMVDEFGVPLVKCYRGNPLPPPPPRPATVVYRGPEWTGYRDTNIIVIQQTTVEIDVFVVVDVETGEPFSRPAGTDGSDDGPAPGQEPPLTTTTAPSDFDFVGVYGGTLSSTCGSAPISATASGSEITISGSGDSATGALAPDGSFTISVEGAILTGVVDGDTVSGDFNFSGCSGTFSLLRTG
jgi:hypothetical protein